MLTLAVLRNEHEDTASAEVEGRDRLSANLYPPVRAQ
jgi:hypothetical protein